MRLSLLLAATAAAAASAGTVPFTPCTSTEGTVSGLTATPYPFVQGVNSSMTISGELKEEITSGTYTMTVSLYGINSGSTSGSICELSPCPIAKGPFKMVLPNVAVPTSAPAATYDVKLTATDQSGNSALCFDAHAKIVKPSVVAADEEEQEQEQEAEFPAPHDEEPVNNAAWIDFLNRKASTWRAGHNSRFEDLGFGHVRKLCGALEEPESLRLPARRAYFAGNVPASYDVRDAYGTYCPVVLDVRDQASCGSCYDVSSATVITHRTCIASNGTVSPYISSEDALACCGFFCGSGCDGGYPSAVMSYYVSTGIVDGGPYGSKQGCLDYSLAPCEHHVSGSRPPCVEGGATPACTQTCQDGSPWAKAKHFGSTSYSVPSDVASIQQEILAHGSVVATYTVYADFPTYKSGVYQHTSGAMLGGHAVTIVGWGVESGTPYWEVQNSWNTDWGNNGYFRILRGSDECGIESGIVASLPKLD